jgi:hypothetical protein
MPGLERLRPRRRIRAPAADPNSLPGSEADRSLDHAANRGEKAGRKLLGVCPVCGHSNLDVTLKPNGREHWVSCWSCEAAGLTGAEFLAELAEAVGCRPYQLIEDGPTVLADYLNGAVAAARVPAPLPSEGTIAGLRSRLLSSRRPLAWLRRRGISEATVRQFELGWNGGAIVFPVRVEAGELVNVRFRLLDPEADPKVRGLSGRGAQLYPDVPADGPILLCAGELDALLARQRGLPAVTTTCGARLPDHLVCELGGRRVAVVYDVGEETAAETTAAKLRAAGSEAWAVRLGLPKKGDDLTDWFLKYGRTARELGVLCRRGRSQ